MAIHPRPYFRSPGDLRVHRQRLYRRAAPVFWRRGYRDAPLKQLASACGLTIPALYRYFPSKRDLALYPLSEANRPTWDCFGGSEDPYVHVRLWIDHAAWERRDFVLALRLGAELQQWGGLSGEHVATFQFHISLVADLLRATAPRLTAQRGHDLIESLLAMSFGADAIGRDWSPAVARNRFLRLLVPDLTRTGAATARLSDALLAGGHPDHGPCSIQMVGQELSANGDFVTNVAAPLTARALER